MPIYTFLIVYIVFVQKHFGSGPFWHLMDKYFLEKCTSGNQWLQNVFFVNNLMYDTGFDQYVEDRYRQNLRTLAGSQQSVERDGACLPWTWFMAVYMQLSIALPFCLYLYFRYPKFAMVGHVVLIIGSLLSKYLTVTSLFNDLQALNMSTAGLVNPARNTIYFAEQYASPLNHYLTFMVFGAQSGYIFYFYIQRMVDPQPERVKLGDGLFDILTKWKKSMCLRALSFIIAIVIILESWALRYYSSIS